jgi:putative oxidoreductase
MEKFLGKYSEAIYAALRVIAGLMFLQHAMLNLFGSFGGVRPNGGAAPFLSVLFFAGLIELVTGLMIAAGFQTGWAAFFASGEMAVGYWWKLAPLSFFPIVNHGENAVLYCFAFLYMASRGSGRFSLDAILRNRGRSD